MVARVSGNLTSDGETTYTYDQENRLVKATTSTGALKAELWYDPLGRLYKLQSAAATTYFVYDGDALVAEYDGASGALTQRYVHGGGVDEPLAWFQGATVTATDRRHFRANFQGSIVATTDAAGNALQRPRYDTWGNPVGGHPLRFGYTGQVWIPELHLWHYKARMYSPELGRFLQTDPVGYADQLNLYAYVGNDPASKLDPTGMQSKELEETELQSIVIEGKRGDEWGPAPDLSETVPAYAPQPSVGNLLNQPSLQIRDTSEFWRTNLNVALTMSGLGRAALEVALLFKGAQLSGTLAAAGAARAAPPAFQGLSRAGQFGIQPYSQLTQALKGSGLQAHHLIEQRFAGVMGQNARQMASVAVTRAEHQVFTNAWRAAIPYGQGTANATRQQVMDAARQIYSGHPEILRALGL